MNATYFKVQSVYFKSFVLLSFTVFFPYMVNILSTLGLVSLFPKDAVNFFASAVDQALKERKDLNSVSLY